MFSKPVAKPTQPSISIDEEKPQKYTIKDNNSLKASSTHQQNFYLSLGSGDIPYSSTDPTLLWEYNIPTVVPNQKKRIIQISYFGASLRNYASVEFPTKIGLKIDNQIGFTMMKYSSQTTTWENQPTDVMSWSTIKSMNSDQSDGMKTYNVIYLNDQDIPWDIGMTNVISLRICGEDGTSLPGPFNNPVQVQLKILHVGL